MSKNNLDFQNDVNTNTNTDINQINKDEINKEAASYYFNTILKFIFGNSLNSEVQKPVEIKKPIFNVIYNRKGDLFTKTEIDSPLLFTTKKRSQIRKRRMENRDNIRRKIKRTFLNVSLIKKLNEKLRDIGSITFFEKFPKSFVSDVTRKTNKEILDMTLKEILEKKELYGESELNNYKNNTQSAIQKDVDNINTSIKAIANASKNNNSGNVNNQENNNQQPQPQQASFKYNTSYGSLFMEADKPISAPEKSAVVNNGSNNSSNTTNNQQNDQQKKKSNGTVTYMKTVTKVLSIKFNEANKARFQALRYCNLYMKAGNNNNTGGDIVGQIKQINI